MVHAVLPSSDGKREIRSSSRCIQPVCAPNSSCRFKQRREKINEASQTVCGACIGCRCQLVAGVDGRCSRRNPYGDGRSGRCRAGCLVTADCRTGGAALGRCLPGSGRRGCGRWQPRYAIRLCSGVCGAVAGGAGGLCQPDATGCAVGARQHFSQRDGRERAGDLPGGIQWSGGGDRRRRQESGA